MTIRTLLSIACAALLVSPLTAQNSDIATLEAEFTNLDSLVQSLARERLDLEKEIRSNSDKIQEIKTERDLGFLQRQKLESLFKDSQSLGREIEKLDHDLTRNRQTRRVAGEKLLDRYDALIISELEKNQPRKQPDQIRKKALNHVSRMRQRIQQVRAIIEAPEKAELRIVTVEIQLEDSPRKIERKADLLKDLEDKFRLKTERITKQVQELQKELKLRSRINELVTDIALFDPQDEILSNFGNGNSEQASLAGAEPGDTELRTQLTADNLLIGQKNFDFASLATEQLEDAIQLLKSARKRTEVTADSLADRARIFYRAAEESKKQ